MNYLNLIYQNLEHPDYLYFTLEKYLKDYEGESKSGLVTEWKSAGFMFRKGHLSPVIEIGARKFTDINSLCESDLSYIRHRLQNETHTYLIARYSHILYQKTKNNSYAKQAIKAYHALAKEYHEKLASGEKNVHDFVDVVEAYLQISTAVKEHPDLCKNQIIEWYQSPNQHLFYYTRMIEVIVESTLFKRQDLIAFTTNAINIWQQIQVRSHDEDHLEICLKLAKKEGADVKAIYRLMAELQLSIAKEEEHRDESGLIEADCLFKASSYYKSAGDKKRSNEVLRKLALHKEKIKFDVVSHEMPAEDVDTLKQCHAEIVASYLSTNGSAFIPLAFDDRILPQGIDENHELDFLTSVSTSHYDVNLNVQVLSPFESMRRDGYVAFQHQMEITLVMVFEELTKQMEKSNRDLLKEGLEYFESTWFNQDFKSIKDDDVKAYNWLQSIRPAIEILIKANLAEQDRLLDATEQMAFDQLAVKFEGMLRDICQVAGLTTTKVYESQTLQMDINDLLQNRELETIFDKKHLELWQFTFTRAGYNIRNNVAHAFYRPHHYQLRLSNLLILCYVKLARYGELLTRKVHIPGEVDNNASNMPNGNEN